MADVLDDVDWMKLARLAVTVGFIVLLIVLA